MVQWIGIVVGLCCRLTQSLQQHTVVLAGNVGWVPQCFMLVSRREGKPKHHTLKTCASHILNIGTSLRFMVSFMLCLPFLLGKWFIVPAGMIMDVVQNSSGSADKGKSNCSIVGPSYHHIY
jgi:ABC-type methionine transport system permease subunit